MRVRHESHTRINEQDRESTNKNELRVNERERAESQRTRSRVKEQDRESTNKIESQRTRSRVNGRDRKSTNENEPSFIERDRARESTNKIAWATTRDTPLSTRSPLKGVANREYPTGTIDIPVSDELTTGYLQITLNVKCHIPASKSQKV